MTEITAAIPPHAYLLPDDATDSPSRSNKPLPSPADDLDGQVFLPPSFLPSPEAEVSAPLQLVNYARILRTTSVIPTDESRGPELDPREAGYLPAEPEGHAEGEEEETRAEEMEQAVLTLRDLGVYPLMTQATIVRQRAAAHRSDEEGNAR